jgi:hypothetical protein
MPSTIWPCGGTGLEAGDWSPASTVEGDGASGSERIGKQFGNEGRRQDDLAVAKVAPARGRLSGRAFAGLVAPEEALDLLRYFFFRRWPRRRLVRRLADGGIGGLE